ncbi:MAG TPA: V-type ATP synthase subunit E [Candidatus Subteraquimicrobiales bacterium]
MPLDDMLKVLEEDGEKQRAAVREKTKKEVEDILEAARQEGEKIKKEQTELVFSPLGKETARILNEAKLEVKKKQAVTKEDLLKQVDSQVREKIEKIRNSQEWAGIFRRLLNEVSKGVSGNMIVRVDQRDEALARNILRELNVTYQLEVNSSSLGGATVATEDRRVTLINTFEARLERANRLLRPVITSTLFGGGDGSRL